jgi:hypothetical protein
VSAAPTHSLRTQASPPPDDSRITWIDVLLILALVSAVLPWGLFWQVAPSWSRDIMTFFVLAGVSAGHGLGRGTYRPTRMLVLTFSALSLIGLLTWNTTLGSKIGLNFWAGWSPWLLAASFALFGLSFGRQRWSTWRRIFIAFGIAAAVVQSLGIAAVLLGLVDADSSTKGGFYGMRPIQAGLALLIVVGLALLLTATKRLGRGEKAFAVLLGLAAVLSQHRSVWLALIVVCALVALRFMRDGADGQRWLLLSVGPGYLLLAVLVPLVGISLLPRAAGIPAETGLADTATSSNTLDWRLDMWRSRLEAPRSAIHWLTGGTLSVNPVKWPGVGVMNPYNSGHNMLIDVSVMFGIVGVVVVLGLLLGSTLLRPDRLDPVVISVWGVSAYGLFYYWPAWSWALIGVAAATAKPRGRGLTRTA